MSGKNCYEYRRRAVRKRLLPLIVLCLTLWGCSIEFVPPATDLQPCPTAGEPSSPSGDGLTVHFVDVGQADCTLLECGGEYMLIDGGNKDDGQLVVSYLLSQGVEQIDTLICTHPHEDHAGGLASVLAVFPVRTILSSTTTYASGFFDDFLRYAGLQGVPVEIPAPGDSFRLGSSDTAATVTVLGPVDRYAEVNNNSIVVRVDYGETSFLFTGDMEATAEGDLLDHWEDGWTDADVLKVGHHGSETSTGYRLVYEVSPDYAVISAGRDNDYGHPHDRPLSRLHHAGSVIFRTDTLGTVIARSDGQEISFTWENRDAVPDNGPETVPDAYVGNQKSHVFHTTDCDNLPAEHNRVFCGSYLDFIAAGYTPCGNCLE